MADRFDVVVVGSLNQDLVARVPHIPTPGETVLASGHDTFAGGKGANQATAAARLGARVAMVGRVGDDDFGRRLAAGLGAEGVDVAGVSFDVEAASGLALINVAADGENAITVSSGANARVGASDVAAAANIIAEAAVVLLQLEIPVPALLAAVDAARGLVILNPAPAAPLPPELLGAVDVLIPNESELALLAARPVDSAAAAAAAAQALPVDRVVVTRGGEGAIVCQPAGIAEVPAPPVVVVDTTGAGDAFCGAVAAEMARGADLEAAVRFAVKVAALAVTRPGARTAMPLRAELGL